MEAKNDTSLEKGNPDDQQLGSNISQQPAHHSYFEADIPSEPQPTHAIPPIPEGASVLTTVLPENVKSPSPPNSSATTGTTSSPASIGNVSSSGGEVTLKGAAPEFPRDSLSSQAHPVVTQQRTWTGIAPAPQGDLYGQATATQTLRYNPSNYPSALKLLVSNNVAGSIIGRGGQTISELQGQSSTRIKLSQTNDYYPGTQDRVCLIQGETEHVKTALRLLLERLYMLQEHQHAPHVVWQQQRGPVTPAFDFVVRLLVPTASCGMIIGKSGSNIKFLEETTGVSSVRLSPKDTADVGFPGASVVSATSERVVTITGPNMESCLQCLNLIVDGMASHPDICRYSNMTTSYSRVVPEAYAAAPRPVIVAAVPPGASRPSPSDQFWESPSMIPGAGIPSIVRDRSSPDLAGLQGDNRRGLPKDTQSQDRLIGYTPPIAPATPFSPLQVPATPPGPGTTPLYLIPPASDPGNAPPEQTHQLHRSVSAPDRLAFQLESMQISPIPQATQQTQDYSHSFVPQAPTMIGPGCFSAQALVPDIMVGSILGRQGRTLNELQRLSATRIRISQRGEYMRGTRSRIVTIQGATAQDVWQAQLMMSQRMVLPPTAAPPRSAGYPQETIPSPSGHGGDSGANEPASSLS